MTDKCAGENCTSIDGVNHSVECLFEHFAAYTGAHREPIDVLRKIKKAYFDGYEAAAPAQPQSDSVTTEQVEVVGYLYAVCDDLLLDHQKPNLPHEPLMTVAQHNRIIADITANRDRQRQRR